MMDENNETFKHDTEFHEFRTAVAAGTDLQHARMAKEVTQSSPTTIRKSVIIKECESDLASPNDTMFHNDAVGVLQEGKNVTNSQLETGKSRITCTRRWCTTSNSSRTGLTSRVGQTFSPIQNDSKV